MRKRDELADPNSCMSRARDDEQTFVLLERDVAAPAAVRAWINKRIELGKNQPDDRQIKEAENWIESVILRKNLAADGKPMRVYIAGPYSKGDTVINVRIAIQAADQVLALGHYPFVPHLTMLWHAISPKDYEDWLQIDMVWLRQCNCLIRLEGESSGADKEVAEAVRLGMTVFGGVEAFARELRRINA